jgi:hypothetical protein
VRGLPKLDLLSFTNRLNHQVKNVSLPLHAVGVCYEFVHHFYEIVFLRTFRGHLTHKLEQLSKLVSIELVHKLQSTEWVQKLVVKSPKKQHLVFAVKDFL